MTPGEGVWIAERLGTALLLFASGMALSALFRGGVRARILAGLAMLGAAAVVPYGTSTGFGFLFAITGPLSAAGLLALLLAIGALAGMSGNLGETVGRGAPLVGILGLFLYPAAVGLGTWDPYALGFAGLALPAILAGVLAAGLAQRSVIVPLWIGAGALGWLLGLYGSQNLWDYVVDPLAWFAALVVMLASAAGSIRRRVRASSRAAAGDR
ncbi:hypothetical protein ACUN0C_15930 [Faunimonas sp. B44]|uniref:hypothetical protein n=1 Tax=Faunimonas sp. B44 TaxID=3461493 RepID=UPI004044DD8D